MEPESGAATDERQAWAISGLCNEAWAGACHVADLACRGRFDGGNGHVAVQSDPRRPLPAKPGLLPLMFGAWNACWRYAYAAGDGAPAAQLH